MKLLIGVCGILFILALFVVWATVSINRGSTKGTWRCIFENLFYKNLGGKV